MITAILLLILKFGLFGAVYHTRNLQAKADFYAQLILVPGIFLVYITLAFKGLMFLGKIIGS